MYLDDFISKQYKFNTEPHVALQDSKLYHSTMVLFATYSIDLFCFFLLLLDKAFYIHKKTHDKRIRKCRKLHILVSISIGQKTKTTQTTEQKEDGNTQNRIF